VDFLFLDLCVNVKRSILSINIKGKANFEKGNEYLPQKKRWASLQHTEEKYLSTHPPTPLAYTRGNLPEGRNIPDKRITADKNLRQRHHRVVEEKIVHHPSFTPSFFKKPV